MSDREFTEYGVLDGEGRVAMPLGVPYSSLRAAEQQWAWLESLPPWSGSDPRGPFSIVQRTRVVSVSEWEPVHVPVPEPSEGEK